MYAICHLYRTCIYEPNSNFIKRRRWEIINYFIISCLVGIPYMIRDSRVHGKNTVRSTIHESYSIQHYYTSDSHKINKNKKYMHCTFKSTICIVIYYIYRSLYTCVLFFYIFLFYLFVWKCA